MREPDLNDMIAEVKREIAMRQRVYKRLVQEGRMNAHKSEWKIEIMHGVLAKLVELNGGRDSAPGILI